MSERFLGLQYPLVRTNRGILAQKRGVDQIKADLLQLILTTPGERVMLPEFGTRLRDLLFEPNDLTLEIEAQRIISKAILRWEPRIALQNIEITSNFNPNDLGNNDSQEELEAILGIKIEFIDPENITEIQELRLELPIGG